MNGMLQNVFIITYSPETHKKKVSYLVRKCFEFYLRELEAAEMAFKRL